MKNALRVAIVLVVGLVWVMACRPKGPASRPMGQVPATVPAYQAAPTNRHVGAAEATGDDGSGPSFPLRPPATTALSAIALVNQKDEIVSVLDNGATVIVKRVSFPGDGGARLCADGRRLLRTSGWAAGLSHLLEHLVAGGSSQRRSEAENRNLLPADWQQLQCLHQ